MVWVIIIKALGVANFKSIYPKILTSSRVRAIGLINILSVSLIKPLWPAVWKWAKKPACLWSSPLRLFQLSIVILIIIPPVSEFIVSLMVILHTTYRTRQKVDQTSVTTCKSMIDFVNPLRLKCLSFYNFFENLATNFVTFPWPN